MKSNDFQYISDSFCDISDMREVNGRRIPARDYVSPFDRQGLAIRHIRTDRCGYVLFPGCALPLKY